MNQEKAQAIFDEKVNEPLGLKRPPLGLMPRVIWEEQRMNQIKAAIDRYGDAEMIIPIEWVDEWNELSKKVKRHG